MICSPVYCLPFMVRQPVAQLSGNLLLALATLAGDSSLSVFTFRGRRAHRFWARVLPLFREPQRAPGIVPRCSSAIHTSRSRARESDLAREVPPSSPSQFVASAGHVYREVGLFVGRGPPTSADRQSWGERFRSNPPLRAESHPLQGLRYMRRRK